jgi:predicted esterase
MAVMTTKTAFTRYLVLALIVASLSACAPKERGTPTSDAHPIYLKDGVSDRQMIRDLNQCAKKVFENNDSRLSDTYIKTQCMEARGYEVSYADRP